MKSYIEESEPEPENKKFPVLKKYKTGDLIVLFYGETLGICVHPGDSIRVIGERGGREGWISCFDSDYWEDFKGKVILEN